MLEAFKGRKQQQIVYKKQTVDLAACNYLADSSVKLHPIHIGYKDEWLQHKPQLGSNIYGEQF